MITNKNEAEVLREILKQYPEGIGHNELFRKTGLHKETISKIRKMLEKEGIIKYEKQDKRGKNSTYKLISKVVAEDAILNFTTKSIIANGKPQRIKMPFPDLISDIFPRKNKDNDELGSMAKINPLIGLTLITNSDSPYPNENQEFLRSKEAGKFLKNMMYIPLLDFWKNNNRLPNLDDFKKLRSSLIVDVDYSQFSEYSDSTILDLMRGLNKSLPSKVKKRED